MSDRNDPYVEFLLNEARVDEFDIGAKIRRGADRLKNATLATVGGSWSSTGNKAQGQLDIMNLASRLRKDWFQYQGRMKGRPEAKLTQYNLKQWFEKTFRVDIKMPSEGKPGTEHKEENEQPESPQQAQGSTGSQAATQPTPTPATVESYVDHLYGSIALMEDEEEMTLDTELTRTQFDAIMKSAAQQLFADGYVSRDGSARGNGQANQRRDDAAADTIEKGEQTADQPEDAQNTEADAEPQQETGAASDLSKTFTYMNKVAANSNIAMERHATDGLRRAMQSRDVKASSRAIKELGEEGTRVVAVSFAAMAAKRADFDEEDFHDAVKSFCDSKRLPMPEQVISRLASIMKSRQPKTIEQMVSSMDYRYIRSLAITLSMYMS